MKGLRKGREAARLWATRAPGGVQQTIELEELYEDGTEGGGGRAVALIRRRLALGRGRLARRRRTRWPGSSSCATTGSAAGARSRTAPRRCALAASYHAAAIGVASTAWSRRRSNHEATEAWSGPLFERFVAVPRPRRPAGWAPTATRRWRRTRRGRATACSTSAAASATRPSGSPRWSAPRARRSGSTSPSPSSSWRAREAEAAGVAQRPLRRRRRPGRRARRGLRLRLLADGDHVLRQPGAGAAQRPRGARPRRPALRRRLAPQARQRVGAAGPRLVVERVPRAPRGDRRADLRPRAVLDGRRRHGQRAAQDRRLRGDLACSAATCR